jgi:hypothetical protein
MGGPEEALARATPGARPRRCGEMADAADLKSAGPLNGRAGSSPATGTTTPGDPAISALNDRGFFAVAHLPTEMRRSSRSECTLQAVRNRSFLTVRDPERQARHGARRVSPSKDNTCLPGPPYLFTMAKNWLAEPAGTVTWLSMPSALTPGTSVQFGLCRLGVLFKT